MAAIAVVALLVGPLYTMYTARSIPAGLGSKPNTPTVHVGAPTPTPYPQGNYSATPGPQAQYISKLYTTSAPSTNGSSADTSHLMVGDTAYVSPIAHGLPTGRRTISSTISIQWYLNGIVLVLPASAHTSQTINGDRF